MATIIGTNNDDVLYGGASDVRPASSNHYKIILKWFRLKID